MHDHHQYQIRVRDWYGRWRRGNASRYDLAGHSDLVMQSKRQETCIAAVQPGISVWPTARPKRR